MYYVYADGDSIYNQFDKTLTIHSPKVTLELGKAGSFQFDIPPTNQYYNRLTQLKTIIRVELDNKTIFYGRVFSITRGFNNIKKVYCEGALSYLIDTLQQAKSYKGKAKKLFENIIDAHNSMADSDKQFVIDRLEIEDTDVIIPGKKDKDGNYYGDKYEQTIIESIAEEWLTTYDYINNVLIEYLGGYLIYKYDGGKNKISYISEDSFDQEIESASSKNLNVPSIDYGINMLDLKEELNAEDLCTVLIPLGDDGLTIEKATNKNQYDDIKIESVDGKGIGIAHTSSVDKYGKIVKSYVFDNVNEANTLFTNGYKYLKAHKNIPISFTVKAVDMHFINKDLDSLTIGEIAKIDSTPHNIVEYLICTKIEYDLEDASKNTYTFGNPKQSLTERYKKNKQKERKRSASSSKKSSAKALSTASNVAKAYADAAVETVNENYATIKNWVEDHYAGIEEAVHFVSTNGEGFVRSTKWVDEYGANTEEVLTWHGKYAESAVSTIKWANDYSAGIEDTVNWKTRNAEGLAGTKKWVDDNSAGIEDTVSWKGKNAEGLLSSKSWIDNYSAGIADTIKWKNDNAAGLINSKSWIDNYSAGIADTIKWKNDNAAGLINSKSWIDNYSAGIADTIKWKNDNAAGLINSKSWIDNYSAGIADTIKWKNDNAVGLINSKSWIDNYSAGIADTIAWKSTNGAGLITAKKWIDDNKTSIEETVRWKNDNATGLINSKKWIDNYSAGIADTIKWKNDNAVGLINSKSWIDNYSAGIADTIAWKSTNGAGLITAKKWIDDNKTSIEETVRWKSGADSSISGIKSTADAAKAMASLFAEHNGKKASIKLSADAEKAIVDIAGDVFVDKLTAKRIIAVAFSSDNSKVKIGSEAMTLTANFIQIGNAGAYSLIRNLYVGASNSDDNRVLSRAQVRSLAQAQAKSVIDRKYILNALKDGETSLTNLILSTLIDESPKLNSGTQIHYDRLYRTLPDFVKKIIDEYVTETYISNKLSKSTIVGKLSGQTITCKNLLVEVDNKDINIVTHVYNSMVGHKHGIPTNAITVSYVNGKFTNTNFITTNNGTKS